MARSLHNETLTIAVGTTVSDILGARVAPGKPHAAGQTAVGAMIDMDIFTPATLPETVTLQVAPLENPQATDWRPFQWQPGTDLLLPANRCVSIPFPAGFRAMRFVSNVAVVDNRLFVLVFSVEWDQ